MNNLIDYVLTNFLIISSGIIGSCFVAHLVWRNNNKVRLAKAKDDFRTAFADDLTALRNIEITADSGVFYFLREVYPRQEAAYLVFNRGLGNNFISKWLLRSRWMAYRGEYPKPPQLPEEDVRYRLNHFISESREDEKQKRDEAIRLIEKLIA